jgi:hypothetical protein
MKRLVSVFLTIILLISMVNSVSIATNSLEDKTQNETIVTTEIVELTEEQYIELVVKHSKLSKEQVKSKLDMYEKETLDNNIMARFNSENITPLGSGYSYIQAITTKDFSPNSTFSTKVELGMAYTIYYSGSFRQINSIDATWTGAAGSGLYEWNQYTLYTYPNSFPTSNAEAHARGAVETVIDTSLSGNLSIKNQLVGAGFDVTLQVGTKYYLRKIDNIDMYIRSY